MGWCRWGQDRRWRRAIQQCPCRVGSGVFGGEYGFEYDGRVSWCCWPSWVKGGGYVDREEILCGGQGDGVSVAPPGAGVVRAAYPQLWATVCRCSAPGAAVRIFPGSGWGILGATAAELLGVVGKVQMLTSFPVSTASSGIVTAWNWWVLRIEAIREGREPECSGRNGAWAVEMVSGVYASALHGGWAEFPLAGRGHPLGQGR